MTISAGAVTTGGTVREASQANAVLMNRLIEAIRSQGITPQDMRTVDMRIAARFDERDRERAGDEQRRPRIIGYVASNRLRVRLRDLNRASALLDALLAAGANDVSGPVFELSDPAPARRLARQRAVEEARREAEDYAAALGMRVTRVLRVSERGAGLGGDNNIVVTGSRIMPTPLEPGEVETEVQVWVDFALAPR